VRRFLQGLGAGVLIATLILTVAYYTGGRNKLSDADIVSRAKKLGMVQPTETPLFNENKETDINSESPKNQEGVNQPDSNAVNSEGEEAQPSENSNPEGEEAQPPENPNPEGGEAQSSENSNPESQIPVDSYSTGTDSSGINEDGSVSLVITQGEGATAVSHRLAELGIVSDATDFDNYLRYNSFSHRLQVGTFTLRPGMSYEEITGIISSKSKENQ